MLGVAEHIHLCVPIASRAHNCASSVTLQPSPTVCSSNEAISTEQPQNVDMAEQLRTQAHTIISEEPQPVLMDSPYSTEMELIVWQTALCIKCDSMGAVFRSTSHDLSIVIPEGAIPKGVAISIDIGLTLSLVPLIILLLKKASLCLLFSSCMCRINPTFNF